ncbi:hypothetical protein PIB30_011909 [Stylosanthes scabra]|uniref:Uncharacterized protein n=1 Tax=Stylosanthes scabra TaxID=79078 RepID=A0ABU6V4Y1_9FABA|nr:hypothetical protein [Stylosanthes scabra]
MAENFLQPVGRKTPEEVGDEYFEELMARSFLQPHTANEKKFAMHDLMHDLAMIFAGEFYYRFEELGNAVEIDTKTRHLSHNANGNYPISKLLGVCDRVKHTRTILEIDLSSDIPFIMENAPCILLSQLKSLRVLSFEGYPLESLPDSIGELIHLRYLDLSGTYIVTLPELGSLYNLQTLKLFRCKNLKMLPVGMQDLVNLRHLDIRETCLHEMPEGMRKLKNLQFLSDYVVGKREENKITELGALANLHKSISIAKLENVVNSSEASMARMLDKDGISSLSLRWSSDQDENVASDSQIEREILDKFQPHTNLKELEIEGYRGTTFPDWLGHPSYDNITTLTLSGCRNCCMLPSLGHLPSLKHLKVYKFEMLEIVGVDFYGKDQSCLETPFPKLETLSFKSMPCWKEWHTMELNAFPQLRKLVIKQCPMLRGDLPDHLPSLQLLKIRNCKQLSSSLPRAPLVRELSIEGKHHVEAVVEAIMKKQLSCLTSLTISDCSSHILFPVSSIPASLQKLKILSCRKLQVQMDGQHHSLKELDINNSCDSDTSFSLLDAFPNLESVYIMWCEKMESVVASRSLSYLCDLDIRYCGSLKSVSTLWTAAPQLRYLSIVGCPKMDLSGDPHYSLSVLIINYCEKLVSIAALMNSQCRGLTHVSIFGENDESVKCLPKEGWLPASLESLTLSNMENVETLECKGLAHLTSLKKLWIIYCPKLGNIEGEKLPASLVRLSTGNSPLLGKRCQMKDPQLWSKISHIPNIQVDDRWIW